MPGSSRQVSITVLAPHIDDEVIGAGGSIAKHIDLGNIVNVIYVNSGRNREEAEVREGEAEMVCKSLKIKRHAFLREDITGAGELAIRKIVGLLREYKTNFIYAPHKDDGDSEHILVNGLAARAIWLANGRHYPEIPGRCSIHGALFYEVHRPIGEVHYLEDISGYAEVKRSAILMYASQMRVSRYDQSALGLNTFRGVSAELGQSAEAFQLLGFRNMFNPFKR
jgi:LmbE family N-acetylglucosaminyl deacetylase